MLKSFFGSLVLGVTLGSVLFVIGALKKYFPFDITMWIFVSSATALACFLLSWRDSHQETKLVEGRESNDLGISTDPLVVLINSDPEFSFAPVFAAPQSQLFDEKWLINSKTLDFNISIMAVNLKVSADGGELHREINQVARRACGGSFLRPQIVGALIFCRIPVEISIQSMVSRSFGGGSGIPWAVLINETDRAVVSAKFDCPTRMDPIYLKILGWFRGQNYEVKTELVQNWFTRTRGKGRLAILMELFNRQK